MPRNEAGEFKRVNGFESPHDKLQFLAWIICLYLVFSFYLLVVPLHDDTTKIWSTIIYALLFTAFTVLGVRTAATDPVDKTTLRCLQATPREISSEDLLWCCFCKCKVHKRSKHCGLCNKCVGDFDHHCKWLNNCVGGSNYASFFHLINVGCIFTAFHFVLSVTVVIPVFQEPAFLNKWTGSYYAGVYRTGLLVGLVLSCVMAAVVCGLLLHLIVFHIYLQHKKLSTYDYIQLQRAKRAAATGQSIKPSRSRQKVSPEAETNIHQTFTETNIDQLNKEGAGGSAPPTIRHAGAAPAVSTVNQNLSADQRLQRDVSTVSVSNIPVVGESQSGAQSKARSSSASSVERVQSSQSIQSGSQGKGPSSYPPHPQGVIHPPAERRASASGASICGHTAIVNGQESAFPEMATAVSAGEAQIDVILPGSLNFPTAVPAVGGVPQAKRGKADLKPLPPLAAPMAAAAAGLT